jgi:hypothetical protein
MPVFGLRAASYLCYGAVAVPVKDRIPSLASLTVLRYFEAGLEAREVPH